MLAYAVAPTPMAADAYEAAHEKWAQLIAHLRALAGGTPDES